MSSIEDEVKRLISPYIAKTIEKVSLPDIEYGYMQKKTQITSSRKIKARTSNEILERELELDQNVNELLAFHGTSVLAAMSISRFGFDLSRSKQCGIFGKGIYLSDSIDKAIMYTSHYEKKILLCRVLMGKPKVYLKQIKDTELPENYDSVLGIRPKTVSILDQYKEFVVFDRMQVLPIYLITLE